MLAPGGGGGGGGDVLWSLIFTSRIHTRPKTDVPHPNASTVPAATTPTLTESDTVTHGVYARSTSSISPPTKCSLPLSLELEHKPVSTRLPTERFALCTHAWFVAILAAHTHFPAVPLLLKQLLLQRLL